MPWRRDIQYKDTIVAYSLSYRNFRGESSAGKGGGFVGDHCGAFAGALRGEGDPLRKGLCVVSGVCGRGVRLRGEVPIHRLRGRALPVRQRPYGGRPRRDGGSGNASGGRSPVARGATFRAGSLRIPGLDRAERPRLTASLRKSEEGGDFHLRPLRRRSPHGSRPGLPVVSRSRSASQLLAAETPAPIVRFMD